ncbi:MAG: alpha/beta fold hydrolase [Synechococcales cyanobacterium]
MPKVCIRGVDHHYHLTAPTAAEMVLVFIHGWLLSHCYWQPVVDQLSPNYQCLSYDLRGFGCSRVFPSPSLVQGYTPLTYAQDLQLLLTELKIKKVWLIGHSLGGTIALWGAKQLPQVVEGVVCVNAGGGIYLKEEFEKFRSFGQRLVRMRPHWLSHFPGLSILMGYSSVYKFIGRQWGRQRVLDFITAQSEAALGSLIDSTTEAEVNHLPQLIAQLPIPVYFISGLNDRVMLPQYVNHLASYHPLFHESGKNVVQISDCGHLAMLEHPCTVANSIIRFLNNSYPLT